MNYLEIQLFRFIKYLINIGYGYCDERDGGIFMDKSRCSGCNASDVQDWIDGHIDLLR